MNDIPSPFLDLSNVIRALRGSLGGWAKLGWLNQALAVLVYGRLGQVLGQIERMVARFQAGTLRVPGPRGAVASRVSEAARGGGRARVERIWPGGFGWLVKAAAWHAAGYGSQLRHLLEQPEMVAFLTAVPQAARVLGPLCRALAIEMAVLRPGVVVVSVAKRVRVRRPRVKPDLGRVPIPRGVMAAVRRGRFLPG